MHSGEQPELEIQRIVWCLSVSGLRYSFQYTVIVSSAVIAWMCVYTVRPWSFRRGTKKIAKSGQTSRIFRPRRETSLDAPGQNCPLGLHLARSLDLEHCSQLPCVSGPSPCSILRDPCHEAKISTQSSTHMYIRQGWRRFGASFG
jgi:hypothetical protein